MTTTTLDTKVQDFLAQKRLAVAGRHADRPDVLRREPRLRTDPRVGPWHPAVNRRLARQRQHLTLLMRQVVAPLREVNRLSPFRNGARHEPGQWRDPRVPPPFGRVRVTVPARAIENRNELTGGPQLRLNRTTRINRRVRTLGTNELRGSKNEDQDDGGLLRARHARTKSK